MVNLSCPYCSFRSFVDFSFRFHKYIKVLGYLAKAGSGGPLVKGTWQWHKSASTRIPLTSHCFLYVEWDLKNPSCTGEKHKSEEVHPGFWAQDLRHLKQGYKLLHNKDSCSPNDFRNLTNFNSVWKVNIEFPMRLLCVSSLLVYCTIFRCL